MRLVHHSTNHQALRLAQTLSLTSRLIMMRLSGYGVSNPLTGMLRYLDTQHLQHGLQHMQARVTGLKQLVTDEFAEFHASIIPLANSGSKTRSQMQRSVSLVVGGKHRAGDAQHASDSVKAYASMMLSWMRPAAEKDRM